MLFSLVDLDLAVLVGLGTSTAAATQSVQKHRGGNKHAADQQAKRRPVVGVVRARLRLGRRVLGRTPCARLGLRLTLLRSEPTDQLCARSATRETAPGSSTCEC